MSDIINRLYKLEGVLMDIVIDMHIEDCKPRDFQVVGEAIYRIEELEAKLKRQMEIYSNQRESIRQLLDELDCETECSPRPPMTLGIRNKYRRERDK